MHLIVLLPSVFIFLYSLYRLVKDDYVFIRKGISLEQAFDIAFITLWISLIFSRIFYVLFNYQNGKNIFLQFFSFTDSGFSIIGAIIGCVLSLLVVGKYKKILLGRISDFFSLSFLFALPVAYVMSALLVERNELLYTLLNAVLFFLLMIFFVQFLKPKLMSRNLKEGTIAILFLLFFSLITLLTSLVASLNNLQQYILHPNTLTTVGLLLFSIVLYIREARPFSHHRRMLTK
ncbi:MAG: prolipoprotein diacylglyceryl transferase [Candidatus Levybacteria bacterium]|nr:prolipoprotein diacylglyceryl transferase [Candidatus Levybacteria bacterium]